MKKTKEQIKAEVVEIMKPFIKSRFEPFDFNTEGSLEETYYYMSMPNVLKALEKCFDETYDKAIL